MSVRNPNARTIKRTCASCGSGAPVSAVAAPSKKRATAGSPTQPRPRLATVIPNWVAPR